MEFLALSFFTAIASKCKAKLYRLVSVNIERFIKIALFLHAHIISSDPTYDIFPSHFPDSVA